MPCFFASSAQRQQVLRARATVERLADALARAVHGRRQRAVADARQGRDEVFAACELVGAQRREADLASAVGERVDDVDDAAGGRSRRRRRGRRAARRSGWRRGSTSAGTMRIPPFVERRMTQYVQPREHPRSVSMRNMSDSSVCGVRMAEKAGRTASSSAPTGGRTAWHAGHEDVGDVRERVDLRRARPGATPPPASPRRRAPRPRRRGWRRPSPPRGAGSRR